MPALPAPRLVQASIRLGNRAAIGAQVGRDIGWMLEALEYLPGQERKDAETALHKVINIRAASLGPLVGGRGSNDT